ncbi:F-actin-capping protein subunit beta, partial [Gorgonomyces haynaldii]
MAEPFDCCLDLLRRLPPTKTEQNLQKIVGLVPDLTEDLLSTVDQPLRTAKCEVTGKDFLLCDYNRDGESYRSPWSKEYQPRTDGIQPSPQLSKLETLANEAFDTYRDLYYEGGVSSVYLWDLDPGFAGVVLIKKGTDATTGTWDSIHVIEVQESKKTAHYKITSTVMLQLRAGSDKIPNVELAGNLTRQHEQDLQLDGFGSHVANMGRLVEDMEFKMRNAIQEIYFGKTKDILNDVRSTTDLNSLRQQQQMQAQLLGKLQER